MYADKCVKLPLTERDSPEILKRIQRADGKWNNIVRVIINSIWNIYIYTKLVSFYTIALIRNHILFQFVWIAKECVKVE